MGSEMCIRDRYYIDISIGDGLAIGDHFTILDYDSSTDTFTPKSISGKYSNIRLLSTLFPYTAWGLLTDIYVGGDPDTKTGAIYLWNGGNVTKALETKGILTALFTQDWKHHIAIGYKGAMAISNDWGYTWQEVDSGVSDSLIDIGGTSLNELWIISGEGNIYKAKFYVDTDNNLVLDNMKLYKKAGTSLSRLWFNDRNDGYAVGANGTLLHWDGISWSELPTGTAIGFTAIYGLEENKFFIVGHGGYVFKYYSKAYPSLLIDNQGNITGTKTNPLYAVSYTHLTLPTN